VTEVGWLYCTEPAVMLEYLRGKASDRKLRLFTTACIRIHRGEVTSSENDPVAVMEGYVDGFGTADEVDEAWQALWSDALVEAGRVAQWCQRRRAWPGGNDVEMSATQAAIVRCIFGNPFRLLALDPAWLTWHGGLLVSMAQRMYDSRDFSDMPVLADGLEEAGCTDADILGHCRLGGEHVRGCWLIDLLLGKS
jgi:hypothetical protein